MLARIYKIYKGRLLNALKENVKRVRKKLRLCANAIIQGKNFIGLFLIYIIF